MLFGYLLFYVLKENSKRETKYQEIIQDLSGRFNIIEDVQKDVKEIKNKVFR
ncbi:bacteriocin [Clostridium formicaceticum]|uniref:Bacteriocin n=1 Tax=Clostridium formicaceticum TaxID=1497 RepID=A0ABM6EV02_9CLOT|nr:bacteriocin [Clostridium formicaceticum]